MPNPSGHPLTQAVLAQLQAEIAAHNESTASVARKLDRNYDTIRRYVVGDNPMPPDTLWTILDLLHVEPDVFMKRARDRLE